MLFCKSQIMETIVRMVNENISSVTRSMYIPTITSILLAQSLMEKRTPFKIMYPTWKSTTCVENQPRAT